MLYQQTQQNASVENQTQTIANAIVATPPKAKKEALKIEKTSQQTIVANNDSDDEWENF